jgi:hypothetical protein
MPEPQHNTPPRPEKQDDLAPIYAKYRAEFSAADLQKYTEVEEGIPAEQVLADMEAIHRHETQGREKA